MADTLTRSATAGPRLIDRVWTAEPDAPARLAGWALLPAELLYLLSISIRNWLFDRSLLSATSSEIKVVSVGNLGVGGAGKTPLAAWVAEELRRRGRRPAVLHGGYGGGDEAELHRRWAPDIPVYVGRDRAASSRLAAAAGADVVVLDDGFQHRRLRRDLDIVLIAAEAWTSRRRLLPRGPWREPASALRRAQAVIVTRRSSSSERASAVIEDVRRFVAPGCALTVAALEPAGWQDVRGQARTAPGPALLVAGIASPAPFVANAESAGAQPVGVLVFRDHHAYTAADAERIRRAAGPHPIATTAKDAVKLERLLPADRLWILRQSVRLERGGAELAVLLDAVAVGRPA